MTISGVNELVTFDLEEGYTGDLLELQLLREGPEPIQISDLEIKVCFTPEGIDWLPSN